MIEEIKVTINGIQTVVPVGTTILEAAEGIGINIPTLCHLPDIHAHGICRMCVVEVEGRKRGVRMSCEVWRVVVGVHPEVTAPT